MYDFDEAQQLIATGLGGIRAQLSDSGWQEGQIDELLRDHYFENWDLADLVYQPDQHLVQRLEDYIAFCNGEAEEDPGRLMEEIAFLALRCLKGGDRIESYQSFAEQIDLLVSGNTEYWYLLMSHLHLPKSGRTIVVEAKNLQESVDNTQFLRLCGIMESRLGNTCHLGIFFTRNGASGFNTARSLRNARATQALFKARTGKSVIVLSDQEIRELGTRGALPRILERKIADLEAGSNITTDYQGPWERIDNLPDHLDQYFAAADKNNETE